MRSARLLILTTVVVSLVALGCDRAAEQPASATPAPTADATPKPTPVVSPSATPSTAPSPSPSAAPAGPGSWQAAGDLHEARDATNVALVGTGAVLVVGSDYMTSWQSACGAATDGSDSVEIVDATSGAWETTTSLNSPREEPALVALRDGRALLTGGANGESKSNVSFSSTYLFDPADHSWTRSGSMDTARTKPAAVLLVDGRVLAIGGLYSDKETARVLASSELWDPRSGAWTKAASMQATRWGPSAVRLADGRALVVGGVADQESQPFEQASTEVYDPATGRWSAGGSLAVPRTGYILVALPDGGALVAGGVDTSFDRLSSVERFDPASNSWSSAGELPYPVTGAAAASLADGRILMAGGVTRDAEPIDPDGSTYVSGLTDQALIYDPLTDVWTAVAPIPKPRAGASAALLEDGSVVLVGGSASEGELFATPSCPEADPQVFRFVPGA